MNETQTLYINGFVDITHLFEPSTLQSLQQNALSAFKAKAKRKDFISKYGGNTPRHMYTVSKENIDIHCGSIFYDFYKNTIPLLSQITNESVLESPYVPEMYVINGLNDPNDTHGWHWDDYKYALVFIAEVPPEGCGAEVETIPHTGHLNTSIEEVLKSHTANKTYFKVNSVYLLLGEETLHRVNPIREGYSRIGVAFTYTDANDLLLPKNNQSINDLYS
jgi:hypothetical protein